MRTTIRFDENLLKEAKRQAAEAGITLTALIEDSLRARIARGNARASVTRARVRLHTSGKDGVRPGIDLDDSASLIDVMDGH